MDPGKQIVNLIIDRLVNDGTYEVVTRGEVIKYQDTTRDERRNQSTAAKIGQLVNASVVVMGSVNEFGILSKCVFDLVLAALQRVCPSASFLRANAAQKVCFVCFVYGKNRFENISERFTPSPDALIVERLNQSTIRPAFPN